MNKLAFIALMGANCMAWELPDVLSELKDLLTGDTFHKKKHDHKKELTAENWDDQGEIGKFNYYASAVAQEDDVHTVEEGDTFSAYGKVSASSGFNWYLTTHDCGNMIQVVSEEVRVKPMPPGWVGGEAKKFWKFKVNKVPGNSFSCKLLFRTDRDWDSDDYVDEDETLEQKAFRTLSLNVVNNNYPPEGCIKWMDGCNECDVDEDGQLNCRNLSCLGKGEPHCIMWGNDFI